MNRRDFLKSLGAAAGMTPLLPSLWSLPGQAQTMPAPLRFVFLMNRNGQMEQNFYPSTAGTQLAPEIFNARLADISGDVSPIFSANYASLKSKFTLLRGLDLTCGNAPGHCRSSFLCAAGPQADMEGGLPRSGASVDWLLERSPAFYPTAPKLKAIRFSIQPGRGFSFSNIGGTIADLPYIGTDQGLFNNVFSGVTAGTPTVDPAARRGALIDHALVRFNELGKSRRLGSEDKQRLAAHADQLTTIKNGLRVTQTTPCTPPTMTAWATGAQLRRKYENVNDIIVAAFTCGLTKLACVYIEDFDDSNTDYSYFHGISHADPLTDAAARTQSANHNRWIADRVAHLIQKLDSTIDVDGRSMLANTVVVWGNEISNYWHRSESLPTLIAGAPDKLAMGQYFDYRQRPFKHIANRGDFPAVGRPYTQLLCSLMRLGGLQPNEFEPFGDNGKFGEFRIGNYYTGEYDKFQATRTDKLPSFAL